MSQTPSGPHVPGLPAASMPGAIPTLNGRGFMLEALDAFSLEFVAAAATAPGESLDIGCAYGVATLAALARGARVCACDMEPRHLELLLARTSAADRERLRTVVGLLPEVAFPPGSFDAILAARVLHFLEGPELRRAMRALASWLRPGARLFLVADTPYMPQWASFAPAYEAARAAGDPWPGYIADFAPFLPPDRRADGPSFLNTLDPEILARECAAAGLQVERAAYLGMHRLGADSCGREHAGCVARKPAGRGARSG